MKKPINNAIAIAICFLIILIGYSIWNNSKQRGAIKEFYKKTKDYEVIRDFIIKEMQGNETSGITINRSNKGWYYYFSSLDRISFSESYHILNQNVISNLDLLCEIEETRFDFCAGAYVEKNMIITFVYDIECVYDRNYNIYWCEDLDILKSYIRGEKYSLRKLGSNWYYVGWE